ncbi:hypothetical protein [Alteribacter keqinensis]|uniref:Uncharacterized protein n=1 Tax=Alteribacter keqinensis TaxID=2483800 RepID=A0A3M7TQ96_9BACI|nr:hypothetical protein [Alteribacter keqinensis]RNA66849.1 hypothetical protein EBO34_16715 [Alteribacter keqinensis]
MMKREDFYTVTVEDDFVQDEDKPYKVYFKLKLNDPVFSEFVVGFSEERYDWVMIIQEKIVYRMGFDFLGRYYMRLVRPNMFGMKKVSEENGYTEESLHHLIKNGIWTYATLPFRSLYWFYSKITGKMDLYIVKL